MRVSNTAEKMPVPETETAANDTGIDHGPAIKAIRDFANSPAMKVLRDYANSPEVKAMAAGGTAAYQRKTSGK